MGQMTREQALETLTRDNPASRPDELAMYVNAWVTYHEASENVAKNGAVCAHPRTGQPMENPYLKVQASAAAALQKLKRIKHVKALWD